jgi:hypothetical protein
LSDICRDYKCGCIWRGGSGRTTELAPPQATILEDVKIVAFD